MLVSSSWDWRLSEMTKKCSGTTLRLCGNIPHEPIEILHEAINAIFSTICHFQCISNDNARWFTHWFTALLKLTFNGLKHVLLSSCRDCVIWLDRHSRIMSFLSLSNISRELTYAEWPSRVDSTLPGSFLLRKRSFSHLLKSSKKWKIILGSYKLLILEEERFKIPDFLSIL